MFFAPLLLQFFLQADTLHTLEACAIPLLMVGQRTAISMRFSLLRSEGEVATAFCLPGVFGAPHQFAQESEPPMRANNRNVMPA